MAKRTPKDKPKQITTSVQLDVKPDTPSYYVNYVSVSHTAYDFTLSVAKIPSPMTQEQVASAQSGKPISLDAILQLVVPPLLVEGLIKAFIDQKEKYEKTLAQQVKNNEIQHQHIKLPGSV
jgi:hypothetical protein